MNAFAKHASIVSTAALMLLGAAGIAGAQSKSYGDEGRSNFCKENPDKCGGGQMKPEGGMDQPRVKQSSAGWKFDPNRHERRRNKDDQFRFYFSGYWYPQPYWLGYGLAVGPRVSCGEGRMIVRDRGFYRVRTVECYGRTYTYLGRRHGDTFRVLVSSRSGRIVDVDPI